MSKDEGTIRMQCQKINSNPIANAVGYKKPGSGEKKVRQHKRLRDSDKTSKTDQQEELSISKEYYTYCYSSINMATRF